MSIKEIALALSLPACVHLLMVPYITSRQQVKVTAARETKNPARYRFETVDIDTETEALVRYAPLALNDRTLRVMI